MAQPPAATPTRRLYLAATDGSASSLRTLDFGIERAKESGSRLIVVMAVYATPLGAPSSGGGEDSDLAERLAVEAGKIVEGGAQRARAHGVEAQAEVIKSYPGEDVAAAIVKFAEERHVDTIFVGSHGATGIMRVLLGSTAERVVKLAHCHVSVVR
jgi:nucleotide-binding universal stress UspA family protein